MSERRSARQPKPNHKPDYFRFSAIELSESDFSDIDSVLGEDTAMEIVGKKAILLLKIVIATQIKIMKRTAMT